MSKLTFFLVIGLCLVYVGLNVAETYEYQTWMRAVNDQRDIDNKLANSDHVHNFTQQLVRRILTDSQTDQGVADILKKYMAPPKSAARPAPKPQPTSP